MNIVCIHASAFKLQRQGPSTDSNGRAIFKLKKHEKWWLWRGFLALHEVDVDLRIEH